MTAGEMVRHVQRMNRKWRKRFKAEDIENEAEEFARVVAHRSARIVEAGVDLVIRREAHYPTPQKLIDACAEVAGRESVSDPDPISSTVCPACHVPFYVAGFETPTGIVLGRVRCECRQAAAGWNTDRARAWREAEPLDWRAVLKPEHLRPAAARYGKLTRAVPTPENAGDAWEPELSAAELAKRKATWRAGLAETQVSSEAGGTT